MGAFAVPGRSICACARAHTQLFCYFPPFPGAPSSHFLPRHQNINYLVLIAAPGRPRKKQVRKAKKREGTTRKDKWSSAPRRIHAETNNNFARLTNGGSRLATRRLCFNSQTRCFANKRRLCGRWNKSHRATREHLDSWTGDFIQIGRRRMSDVRETETEGEN